jgi:predicted ATPase
MEKPTDVLLEIGRVDLGDGQVVPKKGCSAAGTLSPLEAKLLAYFVQHPGEIVRQEDLLREVWAYHPDSSSRTVFTTISRLRSKIERDPQIPRHLVTVPRRGYCFRPLEPGLTLAPVNDVHPTNLVNRSDSFIGRDEEMTQVLALLRPGKLVCLKGTGGIGKTRLAQEAGLRCLAAWPGGVWMCSLSDTRSAEDAIRRVASGLGIVCGSTAVHDLPAFLGEAIAARPEILIILDNTEQIVEVLSELVSGWRGQAQSACFLVTSREPLRIRGEQVLELSPLPPTDAVDLLIQRAACATPPCALSHTALLEEIVERVDHLPLAIELVAGRLGLLKPSAILEHLKKRFQLLRSRLRDRPARHTALHATIDWSWQLLSPGEQAALAQLSVFRGGFDYASAAAVVDLSPWEEDTFLLDVMSGLLEKSLLQARTIGKTTRLNMYQSVRDFAEDHLAHMEAEDPSWAAHRAGYRHACFQARRGTIPSLRALNCHGGAELRGALALELPNLMTAIETASSEGEDETAAHCAIAAFEVLLTRGPFDRARSVSEQILSSTRLSLVTRCRLQYCQSELDRLSGSIEVAIRGFREVMLQADEHGEEILGARAAAQVAAILGGTEQDDEARRLIARSIRTAEGCEDSRHLSFFLCRLGMIDLNQGRPAEARESLDASLKAAKAAGDKWTEGVALHAIASCDMLDGDLVSAKRRCEAAILAYRAVGSVRDEATVYGALGQVAEAQGDVDGARDAFQTAVRLCGRVGHSVPQGIFLGMLGELEGQAGHFDAAREHLERGEAVLRRTEELREVAQLLCRRGQVELTLDDYEAASRALRQAEKATDSVLVSSGSELGQSLAQLRNALGRKS